jgi:regulator of PEP synthase PpsR (kinase-PPPase family)
VNHLPGVFIISDSIGETAEMVVRAAASQFNSGEMAKVLSMLTVKGPFYAAGLIRD